MTDFLSAIREFRAEAIESIYAAHETFWKDAQYSTVELPAPAYLAATRLLHESWNGHLYPLSPRIPLCLRSLIASHISRQPRNRKR